MKTRINQILMFTLFGFLLLTLSVKAEGTEKRSASTSHEAIIENNVDLNSYELVKEYWEESMSTYFFEDSIYFDDWYTVEPVADKKANDVIGGSEKEIKTKLWKYYTESIVLN
jgi:hypothetical protein